MEAPEVARALASPTRLAILDLLRDTTSLESKREGDLGKAGACVSLIAETLGVSQPTTTRHLDLLRSVQMITTERIGQRTFHRRNEKGIADALTVLRSV